MIDDGVDEDPRPRRGSGERRRRHRYGRLFERDLRRNGRSAVRHVGNGAAAGDTYALVESVIGLNFADNLVARDGETASGGSGDDSLAGAGDGSTTILVGGAGTDTLSGDLSARS